jgi:hypothetical protein
MIFALAIFSLLLTSEEPATSAESLQCVAGPLERVYGGTDWLVYGCTDDATIVVVSAAGSPAAPFYFVLSPGETGYRLHGEGNGNQDRTRAAYEALSALTASDISELITATIGTDVESRAPTELGTETDVDPRQ